MTKEGYNVNKTLDLIKKYIIHIKRSHDTNEPHLDIYGNLTKNELSYIKKNKFEIIKFIRNFEKKRNEDKKRKRNEVKLAMSAKITGFEYIVGCYTLFTYRFKYNFPKNLSSYAIHIREQKDRKNLEMIARLPDLYKILCNIKYSNVKRDSIKKYSGFILNTKETIELIKIARHNEVLNIIKRRKEIKEIQLKRDTIFAKAAKTNKKQLLYQFTTGCDNDSIDCNLDIIYIYAMPSGVEKIIRYHTKNK